VSGSVRRSSHVDMHLEATGGVDRRSPLWLTGVVRDACTEADGTLRVLDSASMEARVGADGALVGLATRPVDGEPAALLGVRVGSGFRARAQQAFPGQSGRPLGLLLDDLPVAALIAGYARAKGAVAAGAHPSSLSRPEDATARADLCAGWMAGGTMIESMLAGHGLPMRDGPIVPGPAPYDPAGWHEEPDLATGAMRRRRRIDVWRDPSSDELSIDAWFRDTWCDPAGREEGLHEYSVRARIDASGSIASIDAEPHVLPFGECPAAAAFVHKLVGAPVVQLRSLVPQKLQSLESCTHLNDHLRSLADVIRLDSRSRSAAPGTSR
jgi:hypothetical protein